MYCLNYAGCKVRITVYAGTGPEGIALTMRDVKEKEVNMKVKELIVLP